MQSPECTEVLCAPLSISPLLCSHLPPSHQPSGSGRISLPLFPIQNASMSVSPHQSYLSLSFLSFFLSLFVIYNYHETTNRRRATYNEYYAFQVVRGFAPTVLYPSDGLQQNHPKTHFFSSMASPKLAPFLVVAALMLRASHAHLSPFFHAKTCPQLPFLVLNVVAQALQTDDRAAAKLIRLHFHDCFVNGCDGSVLLEDVPGVIDSELNGPPNGGIQGLDIVDNIKSAVESACPGVVSCADILAISSQISVFLSGGPIWEVPLGRKDSRIANRTGTSNLPGPSETLVGLKRKFAAQGLDSTDLVALSGAHTFGRARCFFFTGRFDNFNNTGRPDPTLNPVYREQLRRLCTTQQTRVNFDPITPTKFDKAYYTNLINLKGLLQSDQDLFSTPRADTTAIVKDFAANELAFFTQFVKSMIKMGNLKPPPGIRSEIRQNCRRVNPVKAYDIM